MQATSKPNFIIRKMKKKAFIDNKLLYFIPAIEYTFILSNADYTDSCPFFLKDSMHVVPKY